MKRFVHLLVACLGLASSVRAGDVYYGRYTAGAQISQFQILRMDENGQNETALFAVGVGAKPEAFSSAANVAHVSHANYNTSFVQGRMWLCAVSIANPSGDQDLQVFARNASGQLVERQVTDLVSSGRLRVTPNFDSINTRWSLNDDFISCEVDEFSTGLTYLIRIAVTGQEVASDTFVPIPFYEPANPALVNHRIEVLVRVNRVGHAWNAEGTRVAYFDTNAGMRVRTVGPLGTFAGPTDRTLDPVLLSTNNFHFSSSHIEWRPVAGSDQIVLFAADYYRNNTTRNGLYFTSPV